MLLNLDKYHYIYIYVIFPLNNQRVISGSRRRSSRITWWIAGWDAQSEWPGDGACSVEPSIYGRQKNSKICCSSSSYGSLEYPNFQTNTNFSELKAMTWDYIFLPMTAMTVKNRAFATDWREFEQGMKECSVRVSSISGTSVHSVGLKKNSTRSHGF